MKKYVKEIHRDRKTVNKYIIHYDNVNPIVHNIITFHSLYPIKEFSLYSKNFDNDLKYLDELKLIDFNHQAKRATSGPNLKLLSREFWRMGEVFPLISNNSFTIPNPSDIFIKHRNEIVLRSKFPEIVLNPNEVFPILNLKRPYDVRGTSIIYPILSDLVLYETLNIGILPTHVSNIYKGLLFSKETLPLLLGYYCSFRKQVERFFNFICPNIEILWPEIDKDDLEKGLWSEP